MSQLRVSRRRFVATAASAAAALALSNRSQAIAAAAKTDLHFFVIGDTHYRADALSTTQLDERSAACTAGLIKTLNRLPGTEIPAEAGGGIVGMPHGVIHAGDLIDSGDKNGASYPAMQSTELSAYVRDFGLNGKDGLLKYPVYEVHGNHDGPGGKGIVLDAIVARNKLRPDIVNVSTNGLHVSWDWQRVHFVNLGIVVGQVKSVARRRRYAPLDSLDFLVDDLKSKVGDSGRPVIVTHHVDVARYTGPCDPDAPYKNEEWDRCDVKAFYDALQPYHVAAIFYGHTHARRVFQWDGLSIAAKHGLDVFNVTQASHFGSERHGFFYVQLTDDKLTIRECHTDSNWAQAQWTPQVWSKSLKA
jgi:predicted phosphodiesterase